MWLWTIKYNNHFLSATHKVWQDKTSQNILLWVPKGTVLMRNIPSNTTTLSNRPLYRFSSHFVVKLFCPLVRVAMWIADCPWKLKILLTLTLLNLSCLHLPCNLPPYTPVHYLSLSTALIFFEVLWHWAPLGFGI